MVHSARIKYLVAQMMVTQDFPVEMLEFLSPAHAALLRAAGETISSKDIIWYQKALARGNVIQCRNKEGISFNTSGRHKVSA